MVHIRYAQQSDIEEILSINSHWIGAQGSDGFLNGHLDEKSIIANMNQQGVVVAAHNNSVVGYMLLDDSSMPEKVRLSIPRDFVIPAQYTHVSQIAIFPANNGTGVGTALYTWLSGPVAAGVVVYPQPNRRSLEFHLSRGFTPKFVYKGTNPLEVDYLALQLTRGF